MKQLPIYKTLKDSPEVVALLGDKIYEDLAPEKTMPPYLVWSEVAGTPNNNLDCPANNDHVMYQIMVYSPHQKTASDIRTAVCNVLQEHSYILSRIGDYENDTKLFSRGFDANWWLGR